MTDEEAARAQGETDEGHTLERPPSPACTYSAFPELNPHPHPHTPHAHTHTHANAHAHIHARTQTLTSRGIGRAWVEEASITLLSRDRKSSCRPSPRSE